jgi:hypothetical protein
MHVRLIQAGFLAVIVVVLAAAQPARAQDRPPRIPFYAVGAGQVAVDAQLLINLSKNSAGQPISIAPDFWYGLGDALGIGLVHSPVGTTGFYGQAGPGICLTGKDNGCPKVYNNFGIEGRLVLSEMSPLGLAVNGGLFARNLDPFTMAFKIGVIGKLSLGNISILVTPNLFIGVNERDPTPTNPMINREVLNLPVTVVIHATPQFALHAQSGASLPFKNGSDLYQVPLSFGAAYYLTGAVAISGTFSFPLVAAGSAYGPADGADSRALTLGFLYQN